MHQPLSWRTETRKVSELIPNEKNPRVMSPKQVEDLKKSIRKFNLVEIPVVDADGRVLAGHQRLMVLKLLGRENEIIPVRMPSRKLTKKEYDQYLLGSNRIHADWDWAKLAEDFQLDDLLVSGFDSGDLGNIFDDNLEIQDDEFKEEEEVEKAKHTSIKPGDYFFLGRHRLLCADALDAGNAKRLVSKVRVDMVNDDIPYNISLSYDKGVGGEKWYGGKTDDHKSDDEYRKFVKTIMQNALSVTKPDAHIMFWCDERYVWLLQELYRELSIDSKRLCIWLKDNASPTPKIAFNKVTEFVVYGTIGHPFLSDKIKCLSC